MARFLSATSLLLSILSSLPRAIGSFLGALNLRKNAMNLRMPGKMNGIARAKEIYGVFWIDVDAIYLSGNQLSLFT